MSYPTESPGPAVPGIATSTPTTAASPAPDVSQQIAALTAAVNQLVEAQHQRRAAEAPAPGAAPVGDIGGDLPGGEPLVPAVDYAQLSPLQQITLGLRDAKPVGVNRPAVVHAPQRSADHARRDSEATSHGAD